jgi:hypothetical protein
MHTVSLLPTAQNTMAIVYNNLQAHQQALSGVGTAEYNMISKATATDLDFEPR